MIPNSEGFEFYKDDVVLILYITYIRGGVGSSILESNTLTYGKINWYLQKVGEMKTINNFFQFRLD